MSEIENKTGYDRLAWFYHRYWGARYHAAAFPVIERLFLTRMSADAALLDLCCGTGHLTQRLVDRGYRVTGIDASEPMLRFARAALPKSDFIAADARAFSLASHFQGALSTFDSLNHLLSSDALTLAFRNVHAALRPGGLFLFDLNMEEAYRSEWGKASAIVEEDHLCIVQGGYDSTRRIGRTEITLFHRADLWQRAEITLLQKCHSPEEV
ncbi:MAG: class I SAM-dependent methyltransferase [Nitrospirae bacterium]|nr:class I SAM-dependent methyltransferase [Candidatus Manganitrophaceae bacterium]